MTVTILRLEEPSLGGGLAVVDQWSGLKTDLGQTRLAGRGSPLIPETSLVWSCLSFERCSCLKWETSFKRETIVRGQKYTVFLPKYSQNWPQNVWNINNKPCFITGDKFNRNQNPYGCMRSCHLDCFGCKFLSLVWSLINSACPYFSFNELLRSFSNYTICNLKRNNRIKFMRTSFVWIPVYIFAANTISLAILCAKTKKGSGKPNSVSDLASPWVYLLVKWSFYSYRFMFKIEDEYIQFSKVVYFFHIWT